MSGTDRRHTLRAPVHGTVILHGDQAVVGGFIHNLSLTGVAIDARDAPAAGDEVLVELRLPGTRRLRARGRVVRVERDDESARIAVRFADLPADAEDAIEDELVLALGAVRRRAVVIVDDIEDRRVDVAEAMRERALTPLTPGTPLEVIDMLSDPSVHVDVCAVSQRFADLSGGDVASFLKESFPWVRIVRIGSDVSAAAEDAADAWDDVTDEQWG
ncbi:MAG: PilZ domain-containing protein [Kofleriaceae bacterium]|nr:PilZ domain-containing protein [Kofleriaceae bacterium]